MATKIPFDKEVGGYNREQVDGYVALLTDAYNEAFVEYEKANCKYNMLLDKIYRGEELDPERKEPGKTIEDYYEEALKLDKRINALRL